MRLMKHSVVSRVLVAALCSTLLTCAAVPLYAQVTEGGSSEEDPTQGGATETDPAANEPNSFTGNVFIGNQAGIAIDAIGVLRRQLGRGDAALNNQRIAAAFTSLDRGMLNPSKLRMVSLTRLERAARALHEKGGRLPDDMLYLAGLTRVSNVFLYPHTGDVVIAGPASGWFDDGNDNVLALDSLQPVLRLKDLAVALRTFAPHEQTKAVIGCSMDLTPEGLDRMLTYFKSVRRPPSAGALAAHLERSLGRSRVTVGGIPANTRFAHVLVAADFRMQLIAMGMERPPVDIASYVTLSRPTLANIDMARWFFIPDYQCVQINDNELAMQLVGDRVRLISQDEFVADDGSRHRADQHDGASERFARAFTEKYSQLAERSPVYAELRNLIDLSIVAAFLQQFDAYGRCQWAPEYFLDEHQLSVHILPAPKQLAAVATTKKSRQMTPDGGGIWIRPGAALQEERLLADKNRSLGGLRESVSIAPLQANQWWWD